MADIHFSAETQEWIHHFLTWVGFGTVVGLLAKAIMPGRDPGGAIATLLMGIGGTFIGCSVVMYCTGGERISPISPMGFVVGTGGAFIILFFYRLLGGRATREAVTPLAGPYYRRRSRERTSSERE